MRLLAFTLLLFSLQALAGPLLNVAEREGDKSLTQAQQSEYRRLLDEGVHFFEAGELQKAEASFLSILKFAPKKPMVYYNLGLVKYSQADYPAAIGYFDRVIQMRSLYTGAAFYYKALAQYNLGQKEEALKTARRHTEARYFYQPSQRLIQVIQNDTDPYFEMATSAFSAQNYELCLLSLNDSLVGDTPKGQEMERKCREALAGAGADHALGSDARRWQLFASARLAYTDNAVQANSGRQSKLTYYASLGGEYIWDYLVDFGLGASYEHYDIMDLSGAKNESLTVYAPLGYGWGRNQLQGQLFYNLNRVDGDDATSETGVSAGYSYSPDNWLLGLSGYWSERTSLDALSDYKAGPSSSYNLNVIRFLDRLSLGLTAGVSENRGGDIPVGATFLPNASKSVNYSLNASYAFTLAQKLSGKVSRSDVDFMNVYSANGTDRRDELTQVSLTYLYSFYQGLNAYLQQTHTVNDSNYGDAEVVNKNYTENSTAVGVSWVY